MPAGPRACPGQPRWCDPHSTLPGRRRAVMSHEGGIAVPHNRREARRTRARKGRPAVRLSRRSLDQIDAPVSTAYALLDLAQAAPQYPTAPSVTEHIHAALVTVLQRYTGQTDLPVGSIFSGRTRAEVEPLVGYFVNGLILRPGAARPQGDVRAHADKRVHASSASTVGVRHSPPRSPTGRSRRRALRSAGDHRTVMAWPIRFA